MRIGFNMLLLVLLVIGLAVGASFGGGIVLGRNTAKTPTPVAVGAAGAGGSGAGAGGGAAGGTQRINLGTNGPSGGTLGTVESVQGDTVTVRSADGNSAQYTTSADTQVSAAAPSSLSAVKQGDLVQIGSGEPDASGHQTARTILVLPARQGGTPGATPGSRGAGTPGARGAGTTGASGTRRSGGGSSAATAGAITPPPTTPIPVPSGTPISP